MDSGMMILISFAVLALSALFTRTAPRTAPAYSRRLRHRRADTARMYGAPEA